jgi:hypothetical protein
MNFRDVRRSEEADNELLLCAVLNRVMNILAPHKFAVCFWMTRMLHAADISFLWTSIVNGVAEVSIQSLLGQSVWDLWLTKWCWDSVLCQYFVLPCQCHSTIAPCAVISLSRTVGKVGNRQRHAIQLTSSILSVALPKPRMPKHNRPFSRRQRQSLRRSLSSGH